MGHYWKDDINFLTDLNSNFTDQRKLVVCKFFPIKAWMESDVWDDKKKLNTSNFSQFETITVSSVNGVSEILVSLYKLNKNFKWTFHQIIQFIPTHICSFL